MSQYEQRLCKTHGETKHRLEIQKDGKYRYFRCIECDSEKKTSKRRARRQTIIDRFGGKCSVCGYDRCGWSLHFHHLDPTLKSFTLSSKWWREEEVDLEVEKCVLLCANCHYEVESGITVL
jgi:hypothetical protein